MPTDHYLALGVRPDADRDEIRAAYLRLMREYHPDRRPGDPRAADTARRANVAYHVLGDPARRARFDRAGTQAATRATSAESVRAAAQARRAYSEAQREYRRAFSHACLRVGVAVVVLGMAVLLVLT